jgi:hypothetical protein
MSNPDAESSTPGVKKHHPSFAKLKSHLGIESGQPGGIPTYLPWQSEGLETLKKALPVIIFEVSHSFLRRRRMELDASQIMGNIEL